MKDSVHNDKRITWKSKITKYIDKLQRKEQ